MTPVDLDSNLLAQDKLADDAAAAVEDAFAQRGLILTEAQMFRLCDYMSRLVRQSISYKI